MYGKWLREDKYRVQLHGFQILFIIIGSIFMFGMGPHLVPPLIKFWEIVPPVTLLIGIIWFAFYAYALRSTNTSAS